MHKTGLPCKHTRSKLHEHKQRNSLPSKDSPNLQGLVMAVVGPNDIELPAKTRFKKTPGSSYSSCNKFSVMTVDASFAD